MNDPLTPATTPTDPADTSDSSDVMVNPAVGSAQQSPLDVLDQILNEAKEKSAEEQSVQEEEEKKKIAEELERQKQEDQQKIVEELQHIEGLKYSPQEQARAQQMQEQAQDQDQKKHELEGMEIRQLGHTKIQE
jgi:hypothetical protein